MIVATTRSRYGGQLDCGHVAERGDPIFKLDVGDRGRQTSQGNGQGSWVCQMCAGSVDTEPA
jgi:hypothetical protein